MARGAKAVARITRFPKRSWEVGYSATLAPGEQVTLSFKYDDSNLLLPEDTLGILHFGKYGLNGERESKWLTGDVDTINNVISVTVDHFSPFVLGYQVPEPSTLALAAFAGFGLLATLCRRCRVTAAGCLRRT